MTNEELANLKKLCEASIMETVVGFGDTPDKACKAFDDEWYGQTGGAG